MKHACKMNTVVLKSFNDRLKMATVSALMAGTILCVPFTVYAESSSVSGIEQTVRNITVKGVVVDAGGEPVIGASVQLKGAAGVGTITDVDGKFTLSVPANGVLQISYIGYKTTEVKVNGQSGLKVTLQEDTETLDEVVVVGYGIQKKASVTGSVAAISSDKLMEVKAPSVTNMLAGRLPGLRAVQRSGSPGDDGASVDIRGYGSMLVIVDGIERDYTQLDPNDIESISILKDAAAAVYGFKGSNGVLLVTTKKGTEQKVKIEYNGYVGFQKVTRYPEMMNAYEYASLYNEAIHNANPWRGASAYSQEQLEAYRNGTAGTDWWNETMRSTAPQTSHNLSLTGGTEKVKYYMSIGYMDQGGIIRSGDWNYQRYNVRSNLSVEVAKGLNVELRLSGRFDNRKKPYNGDNLFRSAQMAIPTYSMYANDNPDYWGAVGDMANPVHVSSSDDSGYEDRLRREFNSSLAVTWQLPWVKGLMAKALVAYDYTNKEWKTWRKDLSEYTYDYANEEYIEKVINTAHLESKLENYDKPTYQFSMNYNNTFAGKHNIGTMLVWEMYNDKKNWVTGTRDFAIGLIPDLDYGDKTNQEASGKTQETAHAGLVGRLNYDFSNRYLVEFNFRYDGTYKFRAGNRWGFFPGVSLGWRVSEEAFFKKLLPDMDNLKIRASYAKVGDEGDFDAFQYLDGYTSHGSYIMGSNGVTSGMTTVGMANPWLTWYESKIMNIGFEASYHRGLISVEFDWFRRNRSGLPATRVGSLPTIFGESMPQENLNSDINTGFEIVVGHKNRIGNFNYNVSANFSTTRIKYDYVERAASTNMYDDWRNNTNGRYKDIRWGKKVIGQFSSFEEILNSPVQDKDGNRSLMPGDLKFADYNGDGIIDDNDTQPLGHGATPRMYYGLNMSGEYKGFDLTVFFQGAAGHDIYVSGDILDPFIQQGLGNGLAIMTDRWHREDPTDPYSKWISGYMPAARVAGVADNRSGNSWSLHNASYLRLKTLELGYTLPKALTKKAAIDRLRFYINCNNLLTFTNRDGLMKNVDPESNSSGVRYYPQMKTYNFGVNVTF
ncbi:SusC/RagA family TonB-linked outer membrane protein [Bacteroides difficilis]|uniref:TonB-dependent receptor n=1 Tax=Bacteroides difficilis TaxID=2763021 RepID=A0ABR7C6A4_9BACE|nr:TonB-dependent receptor [Bacteroides difficilis]MBC5603343.1 TonB-dependent receptor [Bacteroides difficilis]